MNSKTNTPAHDSKRKNSSYSAKLDEYLGIVPDGIGSVQSVVQGSTIHRTMPKISSGHNVTVNQDQEI